MGNLPPSGVRPELYWNLTATLAYAVVLAVLIGLLKILLRVAKSRMLPRPKYVAVDSRFTKYDAGQNWSWDWCLAFPVRKEGSAAKNLKALSAPKQRRLEHYSMRFVVERLEAAGLETKLFRSRDRSVVFCKVRCSRTRLEKEAQRINYALPLAPSEVRSRIEAGGPRDLVGAPSWYPRRNGWALPDRPDKSYDTEIRDEFHQSRLPYEAYAYARYDAKKQSAYSIRMPSNSQFTGVDRLKLIKSIMEADAKKKGAQLNIEELVEAGVLAAAYPLHADGELYSLMDRWIRFGKREVCDDAVKDYFGERIGMYFYFLSDHNRGLLRPAIVGVITHIIALFWVEARNVLIPLWAVYMSCWTTLYLENWKDREAWKAMEWGMSDFSITERARPKFEGREIHSPVTGLPELYFPSRSSAKLRAWSYFLLFLALIGAWLVFFAVYAMNSYLSTPAWKSKFYGAFHQRDACSMAWRCRFLAARPSQDGRTRRTG